MPVLRQRDQMPARSGPGWAEVTCASPSLFGAPVPMSARRYQVDAGSTAPPIEITGTEAMAYVEGGSGTAEVGGEQFPLGTESVLWLPAAGGLLLTAGPEGLSVLLAESADAPGGPPGVPGEPSGT